MIKLDQYKENEIWVAVRISGSFMYINDVPYYVFVLLDAVNAHVFGHVLAEAFGGMPDEEDMEALFRSAYDHAKKWPRKLIVADKSKASDAFRIEAEKKRIIIDKTPLADISPIIEPLVKEFADTYKGS